MKEQFISIELIEKDLRNYPVLRLAVVLGDGTLKVR